MNLRRDVFQAIADPTTSDEVLADHRRVVDASGYGVPTLFFPPADGAGDDVQFKIFFDNELVKQVKGKPEPKSNPEAGAETP